MLLFDQALFDFSKSIDGLEFLPWRFWVGIWTLTIAIVVAALQGSTLVRYFTRFTKDIFNALVALLFIVSAFKKLIKIFKNNPLSTCTTVNLYLNKSLSYVNGSDSLEAELAVCEREDGKNPDTALLSMFLMFGTFYIAYFLRGFKSGKYLGKTARKLLGDFGVPLAILIMVIVANLAGDTYTQKLVVPTGIAVCLIKHFK